MRKAVTIIFLLLVIVAAFSFVAIKLLATGPDTNTFNTKYRPLLTAYPLLREMFRFHYDGDARADYLSDRYGKIMIEVDEMEGLEISDRVLISISKKISENTGKETVFIRSDKIPYSKTVSLEDIDQLTKKYRNYIYAKDTAKVYVLYLSQLSGELSSDIGATHEEYGIALFDTPLRGLTSRNPEVFDRYVASTALHEFGHQLGLPHNENLGCLMNSGVDEGDVVREGTDDVIVDFCDYEKSLIQALK
jgi:predicted Zn-dependent protease